jgi:hypothetical protein
MTSDSTVAMPADGMPVVGESLLRSRLRAVQGDGTPRRFGRRAA